MSVQNRMTGFLPTAGSGWAWMAAGSAQSDTSTMKGNAREVSLMVGDVRNLVQECIFAPRSLEYSGYAGSVTW